MKNLRLIQFIRIQLIRIKSSIAFYPAMIAFGFLVLSYLLPQFEETEAGRWIKETWTFLDMRDASTARAIAGTIAAGVLSLTVFSFSMVMIVLNQAAAYMSNRLLDLMINNRFQQFILGVYIGTIVYSLYILSTISEADNQVPGITIYLLILLTIFDIFLFIYFLHYITQSVKFDTNIQRIFRETLKALKDHFPEEGKAPHAGNPVPDTEAHTLRALSSGYFQEFQKKGIMSACQSEGWQVEILVLPGSFILESMPVLRIYTDNKMDEEAAEELLTHFDFYEKQDISKVPYWGFHQLMEVAIKALSPGINDPVTAVRSLNAMAQLLRYRLMHRSDETYKDEDGVVRIIYNERSAENIARHCLLPIWDYGKNDRTVLTAMDRLLSALAPETGKDDGVFLNLDNLVKERLNALERGEF